MITGADDRWFGRQWEMDSARRATPAGSGSLLRYTRIQEYTMILLVQSTRRISLSCDESDESPFDITFLRCIGSCGCIRCRTTLSSLAIVLLEL